MGKALHRGASCPRRSRVGQAYLLRGDEGSKPRCNGTLASRLATKKTFALLESSRGPWSRSSLASATAPESSGTGRVGRLDAARPCQLLSALGGLEHPPPLLSVAHWLRAGCCRGSPLVPQRPRSGVQIPWFWWRSCLASEVQQMAQWPRRVATWLARRDKKANSGNDDALVEKGSILILTGIYR